MSILHQARLCHRLPAVKLCQFEAPTSGFRFARLRLVLFYRLARPSWIWSEWLDSGSVLFCSVLVPDSSGRLGPTWPSSTPAASDGGDSPAMNTEWRPNPDIVGALITRRHRPPPRPRSLLFGPQFAAGDGVSSRLVAASVPGW